MTTEPVVNLVPDDPDHPTSWVSADDGAPTITLRKARDGTWSALFDRHLVAQGPTPEALTADLLAEHGLVAVLADHGVATEG